MTFENNININSNSKLNNNPFSEIKKVKKDLEKKIDDVIQRVEKLELQVKILLDKNQLNQQNQNFPRFHNLQIQNVQHLNVQNLQQIHATQNQTHPQMANISLINQNQILGQYHQQQNQPNLPLQNLPNLQQNQGANN